MRQAPCRTTLQATSTVLDSNTVQTVLMQAQ